MSGCLPAQQNPAPSWCRRHRTRHNRTLPRKPIVTRDEPRIKFGSIVLMRSMCSMLFDVFDGFDVVRCGSMCSMGSMWFDVFDEFHEFDVVW